MKSQLQPKNAGKLTKELQSNPGWLAHRKSLDEEFERRAAEYRKEQEPLIQELTILGAGVRNVWDLVNRRNNYDNAVPTLLNHLSRPYSSRTREGIARALAIPAARSAWPQLVALYRLESNAKGLRNDAKDGLAAALSVTVTRDTLPELIELAKDGAHGESRLLLLRGIRKFRSTLATQAITDLADDPDLKIQIAIYKSADAKRKKALKGHANGR